MEKRQDTDRVESEQMLALQQAVTSTPAVSSKASATSESQITEDHVELGPQERLGRSLHDKRNEIEMGLDEIVRTTKIPKASLLHIEAGRFDRLPGDVFARGFLRSYARCVGLDADEVVRRYALCGLNPAPVSSELADAVLGGRRKAQGRRARGTGAPVAAPSRKVTATKAEFAGADATDDAFTVKTANSKAGSADGNAVKKVLRDAFDLGLQLRSNRERELPKKSTKAESVVEPAAEAAERCASAREKRVRTFVPPSFDYENDLTHRGPLTLGVIILVIVATLTMSYLLRRPGTSTNGFTMAEPVLMDDLGQGAIMAGDANPPSHHI